MKKIIGALGAIAFLLVLLIKPFEFLNVYSTHAGKMVKSYTTDTRTTGSDAVVNAQTKNANDPKLLIGISTASSEASQFDTELWLLSLLGLALITISVSVHRKRKKRRLLKM